MSDPYRARAPHPNAVVCVCGWRHPVRFHPTITVTGPGFVESQIEVVSTRVVFTCPDCGLEHAADDFEHVE